MLRSCLELFRSLENEEPDSPSCKGDKLATFPCISRSNVADNHCRIAWYANTSAQPSHPTGARYHSCHLKIGRMQKHKPGCAQLAPIYVLTARQRSQDSSTMKCHLQHCQYEARVAPWRRWGSLTFESWLLQALLLQSHQLDQQRWHAVCGAAYTAIGQSPTQSQVNMVS